MKTVLTILLLGGLTGYINAAAILLTADTSWCDTFHLQNGILLHARVIDTSPDHFTVEFCESGDSSKIAIRNLKEIRYSTGLVKDQRMIRQEARLNRKLTKMLDPKRLSTLGILQLLGVLPTSVATAYLIFAVAFSGAGGIWYILPVGLIVLLFYLVIRGSSNLFLARRLRKQQKQESSF
ncbi:MAG: hypothetical protein HRU12_20010 [Phaeodactylibacter sp.]|nr:hypothetical protein [Phaeodactylibacter sp.]